MLDSRLRKNLDIPLLVVTLAITALGIITLFSVSRDTASRYYIKQMLWVALGLAGMVAMASMEYNRFPRFTRTLYIINLVLLALVKVHGSEAKGATRWISIAGFQFQPSEFAKIILIICLAVYLHKRQDQMHKFGTLMGSFGYIAAPLLLIFKQPDLGTSLVLMAIWFGMTFMSGARIKHLAALMVTGLLLFTAMWFLPHGLKDYQKNRLISFVNPELDPKETGYHVIQSRIAIGSGQVWGKGLGKGTQVQGKFIPENHTDFIFTVIGEEGGFVVSVLLVFLYGVLLMRSAVVMSQAQDMFGRLLAAGIISMYAFHIVVNMGMTIGIMPVTGVPLPLLSYGGSSMLINLAAIGLMLGIGMRRHSLVF